MVANSLFGYLDQSECKTVREIEAGEKRLVNGEYCDLLCVLLLSPALI